MRHIRRATGKPWAWFLPSHLFMPPRATSASLLALCVALVVGTAVVVAPPAGAAEAGGPIDVSLGTVSPAAPTAPSLPARGPDPARWVRTPSANGGVRHAGTTTETLDTLNWAGEISTGSTASAVSGTWVVPTITPSATSRDSAEWVGIGGGSRNSSGLIQTGTDQATVGGHTTYSAWYEIVPAPAVTVVDPSTGQPMPVVPGDQMRAEITEVGTGLWRIDIDDATQGWTASGTFAYHGTTATAEWIVEAPTLRTRIETLADFGSVRFTGMRDVTTDPAAAVLEPVDMVNALRQVIAYPGSVQPATTRSVQVFFGTPGAAPPTAPATPPPTRSTTSPHAAGYDLASADGQVFAFAPPGTGGGYYGSLPGIHVVPRAPVVSIVATADEHGYWLVGADGGVFSFGDAPYLGSVPGEGVRVDDIVGMATANADRGYYLVGADGGVFSFGDAPFLGSLPGEGVRVDDIVGMAATPGSNGYWLVASTGRVYAFGAAADLGTAVTGGSPVTSITGARTGAGYWTVAADGRVEAFGSARRVGTLPGDGVTPNRPVIGLVPTADTAGYWLVGADGGVFAFGDADFAGSLASIATLDDIVGGIATGT